MPKLSIRQIVRLADDFMRNNPDVDLPASEIRALIAAGAVPDRVVERQPKAPESAPLERFEAAIATFGMRSFTAAELAEKVFGSGYVSRLTMREAGAAARMITGKEPRRSNGREVYDPPRRL